MLCDLIVKKLGKTQVATFSLKNSFANKLAMCISQQQSFATSCCRLHLVYRIVFPPLGVRMYIFVYYIKRQADLNVTRKGVVIEYCHSQ